MDTLVKQKMQGMGSYKVTSERQGDADRRRCFNSCSVGHNVWSESPLAHSKKLEKLLAGLSSSETTDNLI